MFCYPYKWVEREQFIQCRRVYARQVAQFYARMHNISSLYCTLRSGPPYLLHTSLFATEFTHSCRMAPDDAVTPSIETPTAT